MAVKRASLRGKGASIFFGGDDEELETQEPLNPETQQVGNFETLQGQNSATGEQINNAASSADRELETSRLSESHSGKLANNQSSELASAKVAKSQTQAASGEDISRASSSSGELPELQSSALTNNDAFDVYDSTAARPSASHQVPRASGSANTAAPGSRLSHSDTSQAQNFAASQLRSRQAASDSGSNLQSPTVRDSHTDRVGSRTGQVVSDNRSNLQSPTVRDLHTGGVPDNGSDTVRRGTARRGEPSGDRYDTSIADETRAEYVVNYDEGSDALLGQSSFSEFYLSGETHYLMLEPLATRLTSEQMERLSMLERRIHQGRRRKEPRVTKNSIIRALLEATFDLDLDTRDINSEMELVNRFREALHLASLVGEVQG